MSVKPMDVFPDIHHKMSKKIAQLTKVIYHLNTRNEDHQSELDAQAANHAAEIQQILRDATSKINKFKDSIDIRQNQVNSDAKLEKQMKKHESEKQAALQEFHKYRSQCEIRETRIASDYQMKFQGLKDEVEKMNGRFREKILSFESTNSELKKSLEMSTTNMEEQKTKYEKELKDLVITCNEKFQAMMVEQLELQEKLKDQTTQLVEKARTEMKTQMQNELEIELGQLRAHLNGEKTEALMTQKREYDDKLQKLRDELIAKLEQTQSEFNTKVGECGQLILEKARLKEEYDKKMLDLEKQLSDREGDSSSKMSALREEIRQGGEKAFGAVL